MSGQHRSVTELDRKSAAEVEIGERSESKTTPISAQSSEMKTLMRDEVLITVRKFEEQVN